MNPTRKTLLGICSAAVLSITAVACGDDDDSADETSAPTAGADRSGPTSSVAGSDSTAADQPTSVPTSDSAGPATGEPIKIGVVGPFESPLFFFPELRDGVIAAAEAINDRGGIDGRPIEVVACDDELVAPKATECFRQVTEDEEIVALVGGASAFVQANSSVLEAAGIPWIGPSAGSEFEFQNPLFILPTGAGVIEYAGAGAIADREGFKNVKLLFLQIPQVEERAEIIRAAMSPDAVLDVVTMDPTTVDFSPIVNKLMEGNPEAMILGVVEPQQQALVTQLRQAGYTGSIILPATGMHDNFLETLGPVGEGLIGTAAQASLLTGGAGNEGLQQIIAEADEYTPGTGKGDFLTNSWLATQVFAEAARRAGPDITRESIAAAMRTIDDFDTMGLTPPLDFTGEGSFGKTNIINPTFTTIVAEGGAWVWDGQFISAEQG